MTQRRTGSLAPIGSSRRGSFSTLEIEEKGTSAGATQNDLSAEEMEENNFL